MRVRGLVSAALALSISTAACDAANDPPRWVKQVTRLPHKEWTDEDRLQASCDVAVYLNEDLKHQKSPAADVVEDAVELQTLLCPGMQKK